MDKKCTRCNKESNFTYSVSTKVHGKTELNLCSECIKWALIKVLEESDLKTTFFPLYRNAIAIKEFRNSINQSSLEL